jgi:UDP-N-acetylmuramate dehydrogenase
MMSSSALSLPTLRSLFGNRLQENVSLRNYTTAQVGGPAGALLIVQTAEELSNAAQALWQMGLPFHVLGSGSNVLISDKGLAEVILINRARNVKVSDHADQPPSVWAESGANLSAIARQVALRGLSGLEWAAAIPGTLGGAVYGNAGAHGSDMAHNLITAEIATSADASPQTWRVEQMGYSYRSSILKASPQQAIILAARLSLTHSTPQAVKATMQANIERRRSTQPGGASLGSIFKNPPGDYAGRLIEAAGLKGYRIGAVEISPIHANFFIDHPGATANDVYKLIQHVRRTVFSQFKIELQLEIELLGDFGE